MASHLQSEDRELICETAIALGESRIPEAFEPLKATAVPQRDRELQENLLIAMALLQQPVAVEYLLSLVTEEDVATARTAIGALRHCRDQPSVHARLEPLVQCSPADSIRRTFAEEFD